MKGNKWGIIIFLFFLAMVFLNSCTTSEEAQQQFILTVNLEGGISGTPSAGTYNYSENDTVNYNYSTEAGYGNLEVILDGSPASSSGTITMNSSHVLEVTADIDARGQWEGTFYWNPWDYYLKVNFIGGVLSGTTEGHLDILIGTGKGTFALDGNQIVFNLLYSNDASIEYTGNFSDTDHMSGTYHYQYPPCSIDEYGNWELERK